MKSFLCMLMFALLTFAPLARGADAPATLEEAQATLEGFVVPTLSCNAEPIQQVYAYISDLTGVNIVVTDAMLDEEIAVTLNLSVEINAWRLLKLLQQLHPEIDMVWDSGVIFISHHDYDAQELQVKTYDLGGLFVPVTSFPGPEIMLCPNDGCFCMDNHEDRYGRDNTPMNLKEIVDLVESQTGRSSWANEECFAQLQGKTLIVRQTAQMHEKIEYLLEMLRDSN